MKELSPSVPGVFPDLISWMRRTTLVVKATGVGLIEVTWPDGLPSLSDRRTIDTRVVTKGHPKLTVYDGERLCAYLIDSVDVTHAYLVGKNLETGWAPTWALETKGNSPLAWGSGVWQGWLYAQVETSHGYRVLRGLWPEEPATDVGAGAATGIHSISSDGTPRLWDEQRQQVPPEYANEQSAPGARVGVTWDDKFRLQINATEGSILPDSRVHDPAICRQTANDRYAVAAWGPDHTHQITVACDIAESDIVQATVDIPPYGRMLPQFAYYTYDSGRGYGDHPDAVLHVAWCSTAEDIDQANAHGQHVIAGPELIGGAVRPAFVMLSNDYPGAKPLQEQVDAAVPLCEGLRIRMLVYDERGDKPELPAWAIVVVRSYRMPSEPLALWVTVTEQAIDDVQDRDVCLVLSCDDRAGRMPEPDMRETVRAGTEILRAKPIVIVGGWFSYARTAIDADGHHVQPGGAILYPNVWAIVQASAAASEPIDWSQFALEAEPDEPPDPFEPPDVSEGPMRIYIYNEALPQHANKYYEYKMSDLLGEKITVSGASDNGFGIRLPNGKVRALNPHGNWEERDAVGGDLTKPGESWELFYPDKPGGMSAPRRDGNTLRQFHFKTLEMP